MEIKTIDAIATDVYLGDLNVGYPKSYTHVEDFGDYFQMIFNTQASGYIQSLIYPELMVIKNITTFPNEGTGYGRRLVRATESISGRLNIGHSFIVHNGQPSFWIAMDYEKVDLELMCMLEGVCIRTPDKMMYKCLKDI